MTYGSQYIFAEHIIFCCYIIVTLFLIPSNMASGQGRSIEIIGVHLEGRLDNDPQSGYNQLIKALLSPTEYKDSYQRYPFARAVRNFEKTERACFFPASQTSIDLLYPNAPIRVAETTPIDIVSAHIISAPSGPLFTSLAQLYKKTVAVQHTLAVPQFQKGSNVKVLRTPDDLTALKALLAGRADAMFGWIPDTLIIAEKNKLPLPGFSPEFAVYETTTHLVCKKFKGHEQLIAQVNEQLKSLKKNRNLKQILGKHARVVE